MRAPTTAVCVCRTPLRNPHDPKIEILKIPAVFPQERSENREAKKSRHVQDKAHGEPLKFPYRLYVAVARYD
jgi:hypothetical protein